MRKIFHIIIQELATTFKRPSYLFFAFGLPILAVVIVSVVNLVQTNKSAPAAEEQGTNMGNFQTEGYVDLSGIVQSVPPDLPPGTLSPFPNEQAAIEALANGDITGYYLVPADYMESGVLYNIYPDSRSYLDDGQSWIMRWTLTYNLMDQDIEAASRVWGPVWHRQDFDLTAVPTGAAALDDACARPSSGCQSNELVQLMPSLMVALFFIVFMTSSGMLFNSVGYEKENRTMELLLLSVNPRQLLIGKTTALGLAGLVQTLSWLSAVYFIFTQGGSTLGLPEGFVFPLDIMIWGLVFFLSGFGLYASLMAGAGAMVPKIKEAGAVNFMIMSPLFIGYVCGLLAPIAGVADAPLIKVLSFFPFTSPVVMVMRLTDGVVAFWQPLVAAILLFLTAVVTLRLVAAMFHAQNLLSGQSFSIKRYVRALVGAG